MARRRYIPKYDPKAIEEIRKSYGVDEEGAIRIASSTLDGANERRNGEMLAMQTACGELDYEEVLPKSKGQREGKRTCLSELESHFGEKVKKRKRIDRLVDEWISENGRNARGEEG